MSETIEQPDLSVDHTPAFLPEVVITSAVEILPGHNYVIQTSWDQSGLTMLIFEDFRRQLNKRFPDSKFIVLSRDQTVHDVLDKVLASIDQKQDAGGSDQPDRT